MLPWICEHYSVFPLQQQEISTNCSESAIGAHSCCRHYDTSYTQINKFNSDWGCSILSPLRGKGYVLTWL